MEHAVSNTISKVIMPSETFWRFDMKKHFTISHPQEIIPEVAIIPEEEQNLIKKKKSFRKNALKKEDLARLVDKELALLPITDFWDTKKKKWKTSVYGNFGKRNSNRMKKLFENKTLNDSLQLLD